MKSALNYNVLGGLVGLAVLLSSVLFFTTFTSAMAQSSSQGNSQITVQFEQIKWKSEEQVRSMIGDPVSIRGPIGTHAAYQIWNYEGYSVAFANNRAFHIFDENSLKKFVIEENR